MSVSTQTAQNDPCFQTREENPIFFTTRRFVQFLQGLFATSPPGYFHWNPDDRNSELVISEEFPLDSETLGERPALTVQRSDLQWQGLGIDDFQFIDYRTGKRTHTDLLSGTMSVICLSKVPTEAEYLAWLVSRHTWILRKVLMRSGLHELGRKGVITRPTKAGDIVPNDPDYIACTVFSPYHFQWQDRIEELNRPLLSNVTATANITPPCADLPTITNTTDEILRNQQTLSTAGRVRMRLRPLTYRGRRLPLTSEPIDVPDPDPTCDPVTSVTIQV